MLGEAYLFLPVRYIYQLKFYCKRRMQEGIPSYMERITPRGNVTLISTQQVGRVTRCGMR